MDTIAGCLTLRSVGSVGPLAAPGQKTETWEKRRKEKEDSREKCVEKGESGSDRWIDE